MTLAEDLDTGRLDWMERHRGILMYQPPRTDDGGGEGWLVTFSAGGQRCVLVRKTLREAIDAGMRMTGDLG